MHRVNVMMIAGYQGICTRTEYISRFEKWRIVVEPGCGYASYVVVRVASDCDSD